MFSAWRRIHIRIEFACSFSAAYVRPAHSHLKEAPPNGLHSGDQFSACEEIKRREISKYVLVQVVYLTIAKHRVQLPRQQYVRTELDLH